MVPPTRATLPRISDSRWLRTAAQKSSATSQAREPTRLRLLTFLAQLPEAVSFQTLVEQVQVRRSNLSVHLTRLEHAGMVEIGKRAKGRYAETVVTLTFEALGPKLTRFTLHHAGFDTEPLRDDHFGGWTGAVEGLLAFIPQG